MIATFTAFSLSLVALATRLGSSPVGICRQSLWPDTLIYNIIFPLLFIFISQSSLVTFSSFSGPGFLQFVFIAYYISSFQVHHVYLLSLYSCIRCHSGPHLCWFFSFLLKRIYTHSACEYASPLSTLSFIVANRSLRLRPQSLTCSL